MESAEPSAEGRGCIRVHEADGLLVEQRAGVVWRGWVDAEATIHWMVVVVMCTLHVQRGLRREV